MTFALQAWTDSVVEAFTEPGAQDAVTGFIETMSAFSSGQASIGEVADARQTFVDIMGRYLSGELYNQVVPLMRDALSGEFADYEPLVERAKNSIEGITEEQARALTRQQLDWLGTQNQTFNDLNDFLTQFTEYQNALSLSLETLQENWKTTQESQQKAVEALTAQEESQGRLSQENYDNLIGANRAYAGAITTFDGQYQIDSAKLYDLMEAESRTLMESNAKGLEKSLADYQSALSELENLQRSGTEEQVAAQELVVDQLRKEVLDRKLLQQELQASTSALGRWQSAPRYG